MRKRIGSGTSKDAVLPTNQINQPTSFPSLLFPPQSRARATCPTCVCDLPCVKQPKKKKDEEHASLFIFLWLALRVLFPI